jgi:HK97 family phage prohead protease
MSSNNIEFKAMPGQVNVDEAQGIVECFVAGIGNKDSVGDVLIAGAFAKSLQRRKPRVVWGHNWNDPIGKVLEIYEVPPGDRRLPAKMLNAGIGGLYARVQFNLGSEKGREAFANVAFFGGEQEWSIGYKTLDAIFDPNIQANVLKEVELYEVSPVLHGANQLTGTISVKSDELALAEEEKGWGMMGGHHMMGQMPIKPNVIVIREEDDDKYESEKPIFAEGLSQPLGGSQRQSLEKEIMERTGSQVRLVQATESTAVFQRMMPNGTPMTFRIGYHTPDNYSTFMFGKPELVDGPSKPPGMGGKPSGSRVVVPSQMPSMPMQVKPGYDPNDMSVMPKSDLSSQLAQLEDALMEEIEEKVGKTINKKNLSKLRSILENLQDVIASAEKEEMDTKSYLIPVDVENAFHTKSMLDPIFDYHRVESVVTENGIVITSGVTKDLVEAIDNAQKGIGRSLGGGLGKGRAAGRAAFARFDPNAWDGDGDGLVQEGTPFQRPAIPGVNDRATGGKVNARRAAQAFASQSSIVPAGESVSGDVVSKNDLPEAIVTDIENYARRSVDYRTGNETPIIEGAEEVLKSLTSEKLQKSVGKSISNARKKLAEMLSDEKVIEEFKSSEAIEDFTDQLRYAIDRMIDLHLDSVKKRGPSLEKSEIEEIIDNAISKFDDDFNKLIKAAKDFWNKRRKPGRGNKTVKEAKEQAAGDRESFMKTLKDGGDPEAIEETLRYIGNFTMIESDSKELLSGKMSPQDLNYFLEGALDSIIENDPSIDPKELVNEFADALREGASKDGANPLIVALAKEFGDEKITGGDLINFLNDTRQDSEYRPDRGKIEKEKIRGFASTTQRMDREEDGADYDEAFGPRSRRTNRGMREDPVGEEVAERIDRDSQNAAVRKGFASRIGVSQNPDEPREYMDFVDAVDTFRREMSLRDIQDDYPEETWEVINNIINSSDKKLITDHLLESMSPADLKKLEDAEDINDMVMEIYDDFFNEELPKPLNDLIMDYLEGVIVDDLTGADIKKGGFASASSGKWKGKKPEDKDIKPGADLSGADLTDANLRGADLRGANLTGANLEDADLTDAVLTDANLRDANLTGANLRAANLRDANLRYADLTGADLTSAFMEGANLEEAYLPNANLTNANLSGAEMTRAQLTDANLSGANLTDAKMKRSDLVGADLRGTKMTGVDLGGALLEGVDLSGKDMRGAILGGARLDGAKLFGADLRKANLEGVDLTGQDLRGVDFAGANLSGADLTKAKLEGADLTDTDFTGATMPDGKPYKDSASARGFASSGGGKNRIVRPTGIQRDERGNVDATEARNMRAERDKAVFEKLRELGLSDEEIEQLTGVPNGGRNVERGDISQDELDELNTVIDEGIAEGLESGEITGVVSREEARRILKDNEGPPGNPGFASRGGGKEKLESDYNQVDMTLEEYGEIQNSIENIIKKLEDGDFGADEEIEKLKELTEKIENSTVANDMIPLEDEELTEYLGLLESMQDGGVGMDDVSKKDKDNIDSLIEALKEAQKTGSSESGKLKESGTRLSAAGKSTRSQTRNRKLTSEGTLTPAKKLSITLDDDTVSLLVEEADMIADKTKDRQSIASIKKILQDAKDGKFEVTPEQFDSITRAIEDAFENGLINSDIYGVLHQAAENADGKYDINDFIDPPKPKKGFASTGPINNGAPSDITESMQKEFIFWARRSRGLRLAQSIVEDFDKNDGKLKASQWKALRTMYANMGPGSSRGGFRSGKTSKPTAGFRDVGGPQGNNPLPYVHQTSGWKKVGGAGGLNDASVMQDPKTGKKYYVKHSARGEEFRGESEILTSKLYQLLGIGTINYERGIHNGKLQRVSEWNPGIKTIGRNHGAKSRDPKFKASVQRSLIANAWLANWDGTGNMDNIVEGPNGEAIMADSGGGLLFRAQAWNGMKGQGGTDSFGPKVEEVFNLINGKTRRGQRVQVGVSDAYYKDIEPEEVARQVKELSQVTDEDIRKLVSQTISNPEDGNRLAQILIARRDWISDHWKTGKFVENPSDSSRSDASGAKARPFASVSSRSRGFASGGIDGSGDDERGGGKVTARGVGEMVPGGNMAPGRERREGERNRAGTEVGAETRFAGKKFEEVRPDNWDELTLDEKWQWAITYGNPENVENKDDAMSQVEYRKLMGNLSDEMDKEDLEAMTPAERRAEQKRRRAEQREMENMGYMPENSEKLQAKKPRLTDNEDPDEVKPVKVKKSKNAEDAKTEREARLDGLLEGIDNYRSKFDSDLSENDDHRDVWDKVSIAIQEGEYDFTIRSLDSAIEALDEYIGEYEEGQLTKAERVNIASAKAMRKQIAKARAGYVDDEWIPGQTRSKPKGGAFASASSNDVSKMKTSSKKLASDIKKDIKKLQGTGKPGARGFASSSSGGKTMITDEATFFRDVENSLSKEIRRAQKAGDNRAVKGLSKLAEIIRRDEASKTGSRRTNVGSVYFTADEADEILDGLMFALDTQLEDGGDKRVGWYSKLIEMVAKAAKSTFIDKTTKEITETTRTGTNSRGQKKKINIVPEA